MHEPAKQLTDNKIYEHLKHILFAFLVALEEVVAFASSKKLATPLVHPPQLLVAKIIIETVNLAELLAPEGSVVSVDSIVSTPAYEAERGDLRVIV